MPRNRILDYAEAEDAAEVVCTSRIRSDHHVEIFMKGTGNTRHSRGYGAVIHVSPSPQAPQMRRFLFRGGVKGESLPAAIFRGTVECLDVLATLGFLGATVTLHTDNPNLLQAVQGLAYRWRERGWKTAEGTKTQNAEMIGKMLDHMDSRFLLEAAYKLPERCHELRLAETLSLTGHVTPAEERLEEVMRLALAA